MALNRKLRWLGAAIATLVLCTAAPWFTWPAGYPITGETYERLRLGMTRDGVEDLLGGPGATREDCCRWLNNRSPTIGSGNDLLNEHRNQPGIEYWYQDSGIIILRFDSENLVCDKRFLQIHVSTSRQRVIRLLERIGW